MHPASLSTVKAPLTNILTSSLPGCTRVKFLYVTVVAFFCGGERGVDVKLSLVVNMRIESMRVCVHMCANGESIRVCVHMCANGQYARVIVCVRIHTRMRI